jgi:membrane-bound serine protease (ClpP class)
MISGIDWKCRLMGINFREIPISVYVRYTMLSIPGTIVLILIMVIARHWISIPTWLFLTITGLWVAKELIIFPFVWQAHDTRRQGLSRSMIGALGIAKERLAPTGYIQVYGELWKARLIENGPPVKTGEYVRIKKIDGLKLYVEADDRSRKSFGGEC